MQEGLISPVSVERELGELILPKSVLYERQMASAA
jgi:hypothetical protein